MRPLLALALPFLLLASSAPAPLEGGQGAALGLSPSVGDLSAPLAPTSYGALTTIGAYSGEPNIAAAPDGSVYITGLGWSPSGGGTMVFKRAAGASSFQYLGMPNVPFGGNDETIAIADDGTVWISGMYGFAPGASAPCASLTRSRDGGATWDPTLPGICLADSIDRQWIAVDGDGIPWIMMHELCCSGQHTAYRSLDGGATFLPAGVVAVNGGFPGNLVVDRVNDRVYSFTNCDRPVRVAACAFTTSSLAPTPVWAPSVVARYSLAPPGLGHIAGAVDDAGNVYATFVDRLVGDTRPSVYVARSTDGGITWSAPARMSSGSTLTTMPWIAGGADGNVAIVWYEASAGVVANSAPANTQWNVKAAIVRGWTGAAPPAPSVTTLTTTPNHIGPLCTNGASCGSAGIDRDLLDFFEATVGPDGTLHVVWPDDANGYVLRVADVDADLR